MLKIYDMVFLSPIGTIGINIINDKVHELKFINNLKESKSKDSFHKDLSRQLDLYFKKS